MDQPAGSSLGQEPPFGHHDVKLEDKGRIKLPARLKKHMAERFPGEKVFITSLDLAIGRIFALSVWKSKLAKLEQAQEDENPEIAEMAELTVFRANKFGTDQVIDDQGRIMVPPKLRELLAIRTGDGEAQTIWLEWTKDSISIYNEAEYERRSTAATTLRAGEKQFQRRMGF